jgi:hypothetical protein
MKGKKYFCAFVESSLEEFADTLEDELNAANAGGAFWYPVWETYRIYERNNEHMASIILVNYPYNGVRYNE